MFICESAKVILRAVSAGYEPVSLLTSIKAGGDLDEETGAVYEAFGNVPVYRGDDSVLRELAGYALTGGILAAMKRRAEPSPCEILAGKKRVVVLEDITNPTNMGAIFRSAAALGIEGVLITADSTDPFYRRAERVSMGTVFQIPWTRLKKDENFLSLLSREGFSSIAMALTDEAASISDPRIKSGEKLAIILGNEGYGLKRETIEGSDHIAMIPMKDGVDSLNVAAASAVMFWELLRI